MVPCGQFPGYFDTYGRREPQTISHVPRTVTYGHPEMGTYGLDSTIERQLAIGYQASHEFDNSIP